MRRQYHYDSLEHLRKRQTFSYLIFITLLVFVARLSIFVRQRASDSFAEIDTRAMAQIALIGFVCFLLLICPLSKMTLKAMRGTAGRAFLWFYVTCAISSIWSPIPEYTIYRAVEFISLYFAVFVALFYSRDFRQAEMTALVVAAVSLLLMAGMQLRFYGLSFSLVHWHSNTFPTAAAMVLCYSVGESLSPARRRAPFLYLLAGFSALFLFIGTSSGSNISAVCGFAVAALMCRNFKFFFLSVSAGILGAFFIDWNSILTMLLPGKELAALQSLTGRVWLWDIFINNYLDEPLLGSGFAVIPRLSEHYTTNAHNGYLGALLGAGLLGAVFYVGALLRFAGELFKFLNNIKPGAVGAVAAITAGLANNMTISLIGEQWALPTISFVVFLSLHTYVLKGVWGHEHLAPSQTPSRP